MPSFWRSLRKGRSYRVRPPTGDTEAERGTLDERLVRRQVTRKRGRRYTRLWR